MSDGPAAITGLPGLPAGPADTGILVVPKPGAAAVGPPGYWWDPDLARVMEAVANPVWLRPARPGRRRRQASEPLTGAAGPAASAGEPSAGTPGPPAGVGGPLAGVGGPSTGAGGPVASAASADSPGEVGEPDGQTVLEPDDEAEAALAAAESGDWPVLPMGAVAGRVVETMAPGPALAAWLASGAAEEVEDGAQAGVMLAWRRLASWAQAGELASVAQMAARAAARDADIPVAEDGRPASIPRDAAAEVSFALRMPESTAAGWADLAVTLSWRLRATMTALQMGSIDLYRARLIADETAVLDEPSARAVETEVLPKAGEQTSGQLRRALRRAVIRVDPDAADRRRKAAERRARVCLFGDEDGTATLSGQGLPGPGAVAAMARMTAMARAMMASGAGGGIDFLRAQIYLGLLLGTLPLIPPAKDGPPDPGGPPDRDRPPDPGGPPDPDGPPNPDGPPDSDASPDPGGQSDPGSPPDSGGPPASGPDRNDPDDLDDPGPFPADHDPWEGMSERAEPDGPDGPAAPRELRDRDGPGDRMAGAWQDGDDWWATDAPVPAWPPLPGLTGTVAGLSAVRGTLDLTVSWRTLAGLSPEPGQLNLLGPVTGHVARLLADPAARDPLAEWRVIVVDGSGAAVAVARMPRKRARSPGSGPGPAAPSSGLSTPGGGLVRRVSLIISLDLADGSDLGELGLWAAENQDADGLNGLLVAALKTAATAWSERAAPGACVHPLRSMAYRPPPRLRALVVARDQTCRSPTCRRPAGQGDLDHTVPFDDGGATCSCNLGGFCRSHHRLKQHPHWQVSQPEPGMFIWTTPSGRQYVTRPDPYQV